MKHVYETPNLTLVVMEAKRDLLSGSGDVAKSDIFDDNYGSDFGNA